MNISLDSFKQSLFLDLERELKITRVVLERLPEAHFSWKPHEKSMSLGRLAGHVADLPEWMRVTLAQDELDVASAPRPAELRGHADLMERFDRQAAGLLEAVGRFDVAKWEKPWSMCEGKKVVVTRARSVVYRVWCLNHLIHHRGQLCLYLRLLNVAVPAVYFNSADEPEWVFE